MLLHHFYLFVRSFSCIGLGVLSLWVTAEPKPKTVTLNHGSLNVSQFQEGNGVNQLAMGFTRCHDSHMDDMTRSRSSACVNPLHFSQPDEAWKERPILTLSF